MVNEQTDSDLLTARLAQVAELEAQYERIMADLRSERAELEGALRTIARLKGAAGIAPRPSIQPPAARASSATPPSALSMPEMLLNVLTDAFREGRKGLTPKEMNERVRIKFGREMRSEHTASIVWRIWKQGRVVKVGEGGVYSLPQKNEATDLLSSPDQSAASNVQHSGTEGREAVPGGGT